MTEDKPFGGASKTGESILGPLEKKFVAHWVKRVPACLETYHLTMMTIPWCVLVIWSAWKTSETGDIHWFWGVSIAVVLQYITDLFDGAVGRTRDTGLVKWGFYMDHFLDYLFQCSLIAAYALIAPTELNLNWWFFGILAVTSGYMVNSFLRFAATNEFEIYFLGIGPTEIRIYFLSLNAVIILFDPEREMFRIGVPAYALVLTAGLAYLAYDSHRKLWTIDMQEKRKAEGDSD